MARLISAASGDVLLDRLEIAETFWTRLKGLQFRAPLPPGGGVLLSPCSSLHTCFMRFAIDVIHLDAQDRVISISRGVRPWRLHFCPRGTRYVVETMPGALTLDGNESVRID